MHGEQCGKKVVCPWPAMQGFDGSFAGWQNMQDGVRGKSMGVSLIFKIAAVGILVTILSQVLKHSGREEHAFLISLAGLILVLTWIVPYIYDLFITIQSLFDLT